MPEATGAARGILKQVRQEMERSYQPPREASAPAVAAEPHRAPAADFSELRSALGALSASYAAVGQLPPAPPTFRGRMGARIVRLVQKLLFWYTPQIVHFQYSAVRAFESVLRSLEQQAAAGQRVDQIAEDIQQVAKSVEQLEHDLRLHKQDWEAFTAAALAHFKALEAELQNERREREAAQTTMLLRTDIVERRIHAFRMQLLPYIDDEVAKLNAKFAAHAERIGRDVLRLKAQQRVLEEGGSQPAGTPKVTSGNTEDAHQIDSFYAALEDEFRGSREEIKKRVQVYLPELTTAGIGSEAMPILDVGCGRGEWLELLRENQLQASGVDLNRVELEICRELDLRVVEADAVAHLRSLPEGSLGAVTAFHLIEHLPLAQLLNLLDAARRALKPGGMLICETPNPNNLFVSSRYFYLDPTHRHPIPPELGRFLVASRGFERVEIVELHPWPAEHHVDVRTGGEVAARFNECFYGPQDYAIVATKA